MARDGKQGHGQDVRRVRWARLLAALPILAALALTFAAVPARALEGVEVQATDVVAPSLGDPSPGCVEAEDVSARSTSPHSLAEAVRVQALQQGVGWRAPVEDGGSSGGDGSGHALQSVRLELVGPVSGSIEYRVRQGSWTPWARNGAASGSAASTSTAFEARLSGNASRRFDLYYRSHCEVGDWLGWAKDGETSGSGEGEPVVIDAVQVRLVPKGGAAPGDGGTAASPTYQVPTLTFTASGDGRDEYEPVASGDEVGEAGTPLKDVRAWLDGSVGRGSIRYRVCLSHGWTPWASDGEDAVDWSLESITQVQFSLTDTMADYFDLWYRTRVAGVGWLDYAKGPYSAGVATNRLAVEAIQLLLVPKGSPAPGPTSEPCLTDLSRYDCGDTTDYGRAIVETCFEVPSPGGGLCAKWVSQVIDRVTGYYFWLDADGMYYQIRTVDRSELVPGMALAVSTHSHTTLGSIYGHVAFYIGNGLIMDNAGYIRTATLDSWCEYYSDRVPVHFGWLQPSY